MGAPDLYRHLHRAGFTLCLTSDGGIKVSPASALDEADRLSIRQNRAGLLALLARGDLSRPALRDDKAPSDDSAELADLIARRDRLIRWGWTLADAQGLAERLTRNALDGDDRATCVADCSHYRPGLCGSHRRAGLAGAAVGNDLASLPQRCPGFQSAR